MEDLRKKYTIIKGFTMIEAITSFSIFTLIVLILLKLYLPLNDLTNKYRKSYLENYYIEEALNFMEFKLKYSTQVMIEGKRLVYEENKDIKEWRAFEIINNSLVWRHRYNSGTYNYVIRNIYGMDLLDKGNLIYVTIFGKDKKEYVRCIEKVKYTSEKDEGFSYGDIIGFLFNNHDLSFS